MNEIVTYNAKNIIMTMGTHIVTGYAEDSFITIDPAGDAVTYKVGCQGEVVRSINPDMSVTVKLVLLYGTRSRDFLSNMVKKDRADGSGIFPVEIKDLAGGVILSAKNCWVTKTPSKVYGKEAQNGEYTILCADPEEF